MNAIKRIESMFIDAIAAVTPWLAPLIPAYLVFHNMTERLGYPFLFGLIGAAAVEFLGLSAVHTAVTFYRWNDTHKIERAPFWFAFGAGLFYVTIVLTVNAALDIWRDNEGVKILAHALLSLLSVDAAVIIAIRAQHARMLNDKALRKQGKMQGKPTQDNASHLRKQGKAAQANASAAAALLAFYASNPQATQDEAADHVAQLLNRTYTRQAVQQQLKRLEAQGKVDRNGQVTVLDSVQD